MLRYVLATVGSATSHFTSAHTVTCTDLVEHSQCIPDPAAFSDPDGTGNQYTEERDDPKYETIYDVLSKDDFYDILGVTPRIADDPSVLRRAYLQRSRRCHPDKFPENERSTLAFQKISLAYNILSQPSTRKAYDANPYHADIFASQRSAEDTFDGVLQTLFADFMSGDFEIIRIVLRTIKEVNPALNMEEETIDSVLNAFRKLREIVLGTRTYVRVMRIELLRLYDIQYSLRQLPYLAISARLRLSLRFTRVALSLPNAIDRAIEAEDAERERRRAAHAAAGLESGFSTTNTQVKKRSSILGPKVGGVVNMLVTVLEKSESVF